MRPTTFLLLASLFLACPARARALEAQQPRPNIL